MRFESLPLELQVWFREAIGRGCSSEMLQQALRAEGYARQYVADAVAGAFAELRPQPNVLDVKPAAPVQVQPQTVAIAPSQNPNAIDAGDRKVDVLFTLSAPRIQFFGGLLTAAECAELIELSRPKMARSGIVNPRTGAFEANPVRTSSDTHFQRNENELIARIERRIAALTDHPAENGEPIQILHYAPGAEYRPHFDFFEPAFAGNEAVLSMGGQRVASLVIYLNDVEAGGATLFPKVGLEVLPRQGHGVYFAYTDENGELDRRTLHSGTPVIAGEKWIATKFFRQRAYGAPSA